MTIVKWRPALAEIKSLLSADKDFLKPLVRAVLQEVLEAEMTEALGAAKGERVEGRLGYRSGHYSRSLVTRIGKIELRIPQDRATGHPVDDGQDQSACKVLRASDPDLSGTGICEKLNVTDALLQFRKARVTRVIFPRLLPVPPASMRPSPHPS